MKILHTLTKKENKTVSPRAELIGLLCLLLALGAFCVGAARVLTPKRQNFGATWEMFLNEPENSVDALFLGSSLAYCDIVPAVLYEESGIPTYVMAGPEQPMPATYYYLRESLRTQSPGTVFIECTGLAFNWKSDPAHFYNPNLTFMPWTENRMIPALSYTEGDTLAGLLFPLYAYHGRWADLSLDDLKPLSSDPLAGYTYLEEICPLDDFTQRGISETLEESGAYAENLECARKIIDLCGQRGIRTVFYITPSVGRLAPHWKERIAGDLAEMGVELIDFNDRFDELDLDMQTDFFDSFHLNCRGAEKFSRWLAPPLTQWVTPTVSADDELWRERAAHFYGRLEETLNSEPKYKDDSTAAKATANKENEEGKK